MTDLPNPCPPVTTPVAGGAKFPVRRIYCVGKNYDAHAREMGWEGTREPPFYFTKFADTLTASGATIAYPPRTDDFHYEGELVVALGAPLSCVSAEQALDAVYGYATGLDMTRRDLQGTARKAGRPWDLGKNFDHAAVIGTMHPVAEVGHLAGAMLTLSVDGEERQTAPLTEMIFGIAEILADLSSYGPLAAGDLIFTGTPAGVGPVMPGNRIEVAIDGLTSCVLTIGPRA